MKSPCRDSGKWPVLCSCSADCVCEAARPPSTAPAGTLLAAVPSLPSPVICGDASSIEGLWRVRSGDSSRQDNDMLPHRLCCQASWRQSSSPFLPVPVFTAYPCFLPGSGALLVDVRAALKRPAPTPDDLQGWGRKRTARVGAESTEKHQLVVSLLSGRGDPWLICHLRTCYPHSTLPFTHSFLRLPFEGGCVQPLTGWSSDAETPLLYGAESVQLGRFGREFLSFGTCVSPAHPPGAVQISPVCCAFRREHIL